MVFSPFFIVGEGMNCRLADWTYHRASSDFVSLYVQLNKPAPTDPEPADFNQFIYFNLDFFSSFYL